MTDVYNLEPDFLGESKKKPSAKKAKQPPPQQASIPYESLERGYIHPTYEQQQLPPIIIPQQPVSPVAPVSPTQSTDLWGQYKVIIIVVIALMIIIFIVLTYMYLIKTSGHEKQSMPPPPPYHQLQQKQLKALPEPPQTPLSPQQPDPTPNPPLEPSQPQVPAPRRENLITHDSLIQSVDDDELDKFIHPEEVDIKTVIPVVEPAKAAKKNPAARVTETSCSGSI